MEVVGVKNDAIECFAVNLDLSDLAVLLVVIFCLSGCLCLCMSVCMSVSHFT